MTRHHGTLLTVCLLGLTACGLWVQSPKKPGGTSTSEQPDPDPAALAKTPAAAVNLIETAAKSVGGGIKGLSGASLALLGDGEEIAGCAASNEPVSGDATKNTAKDENGDAVLPDTDPTYAAGRFYCMIAANSGDEGSILGAFDLPKLVTCLAGEDLTYDGVEKATDVVASASPCFAEKAPEGLPATIGVKVTANKPAVGGGEGWDASYDMAIFDGDARLAGIKMLMMATDTRVAVAFLGGGTATDAFAFHLDVQTGVLRYEGKFLRIPAGEFSDHTRLLVKGTVDAAGNFSAVSSIAGARSSIYNVEGTTSVKSGVLMTIRGDAGNGYRTHAYKCGGDPCNEEDLASFPAIAGSGLCSGGPAGATCDGNDGLRLAAPEDLAFLMRPAGAGFEPSSAWLASLSPLVFDEVTLTQSQR